MRLVFLGPPGVGKGTQAKVLAERHGLAHISTGDMLRSAVQRGTPAGLKAKPIMDAGALVPDGVVLDLVEERVAEPDTKKGFVLDGYPRTAQQAADLGALLERRGTPLDAVVLFDMDIERIVPRLAGRRVSLTSGQVYHVDSNPPKVAGRCDVDGSELVQRPDDQESVVRERMLTYRAKTEPLIAYYEGVGLLVRVDADGAMDEIGARVERALDERMRGAGC